MNLLRRAKPVVAHDLAPQCHFSRNVTRKFSGRIKRGQHLCIMTPGGGGFGRPQERDRAALINNFVEGKISADKIKRDYDIDIELAAAER